MAACKKPNVFSGKRGEDIHSWAFKVELYLTAKGAADENSAKAIAASTYLEGNDTRLVEGRL